MNTLVPLPFVQPQDKPYLDEENEELQEIVKNLALASLVNSQQQDELMRQVDLGEVLDIPQFSEEQWPLVFERLGEIIGDTRYDVQRLGRGNILFIKHESLNPFGSHYDRVYLRLFSDFVKSDKKDKDVIEISSGNAAVSSTVMAQLLGKNMSMVVPTTAYQIRQTLVQRLGATVYPSPRSEGLEGANRRLRQLLESNSAAGKPAWFLNHSELDSAVEAMEMVADEMPAVDFFFSAMGNGTSLRGIGAPLIRQCKTRVLGVRYNNPTGSKEMLMPGGDSVTIPFRHLREFPPECIEWVEFETVRQRSKKDFLGLTSAMVRIAVEQFIVRKNIQSRSFLVINYDHANRYAG